MATLERCDEPPQEALAFYNSSDTVLEHSLIIGAQRRYWQGVNSAGAERVNPVAYTISGSALNRLDDALASTALLMASADAENGSALEPDRRSAVGLTGFTVMFQRIIRATDAMVDAIGEGAGDALMDVALDEHGMYAEDRMHIYPEAVEQVLPSHQDPDEWFFDGRLYVHRRTPATDHVRDRTTLYAMEHNVNISPENLITLSGSLPSNHAV